MTITAIWLSCTKIPFGTLVLFKVSLTFSARIYLCSRLLITRRYKTTKWNCTQTNYIHTVKFTFSEICYHLRLVKLIDESMWIHHRKLSIGIIFSKQKREIKNVSFIFYCFTWLFLIIFVLKVFSILELAVLDWVALCRTPLESSALLIIAGIR